MSEIWNDDSPDPARIVHEASEMIAQMREGGLTCEA